MAICYHLVSTPSWTRLSPSAVSYFRPELKSKAGRIESASGGRWRAGRNDFSKISYVNLNLFLTIMLVLRPTNKLQKDCLAESRLNSRLRGSFSIAKTTDNPIFVIPGLTRNPAVFQILMLLDAGSVIPVPDQVRDDVSGIPNIWNHWILAYARMTLV